MRVCVFFFVCYSKSNRFKNPNSCICITAHESCIYITAQDSLPYCHANMGGQVKVSTVALGTFIVRSLVQPDCYIG
jgi:hypothetical protein